MNYTCSGTCIIGFKLRIIPFWYLYVRLGFVLETSKNRCRNFATLLCNEYYSDKSRVLKCFTDDDIDFCTDDGVDVPVMNFDPSDSESDDYDDPGGFGKDSDLFKGLDKQLGALSLESNARMRQNASEV